MGFYTCFYLIPTEPAFLPDAAALRRSVHALKDVGAFVPWSVSTLQGSGGGREVATRTLTPEAALERALADGLTDFRMYQRLRRSQSALLDGLSWEHHEDRFEPELFGLELYRGCARLDSSFAGFRDRKLSCGGCGRVLPEEHVAVPNRDRLLPATCPGCGASVDLLAFEAWETDDSDRRPMISGRPAARAMVSLEFGKGWPIEHGPGHQWLPDRRLQGALEAAWGVSMRPLVYVS